MSSLRSFLLLAAFIVSIASCDYGSGDVEQPGINASKAGNLAMEQYDTNGDGIVSGAELDAAPSLNSALSRLDADSDGGVSADEVAARINVWKGMRIALASIMCQVTLDGKPLQGATIVFEPESFLGDEVKTASGVTDQTGHIAPSIAREDLPNPKMAGGMHLGFYRVRISKQQNGEETIPARYNKDSTLGQEVSYDEPAIEKGGKLVFALKSGG